MSNVNQTSRYSKNNSMQLKCTRRILEKYLGFVKFQGDGEETFLDVGSGTGDLTDLLLTFLPKKFKKLVGCDVTEACVKAANSKNRRENVNFVKMNITTERIPLHLDHQFDYIFSLLYLHCVHNHRQTLANMHRLLQPGGTIFVAFVYSSPCYDVYDNLYKNPKWKNYMTNYKTYQPPFQNVKNPILEYERLLIEADFSVRMVVTEDMTHIYSSTNSCRKAFEPINPFIKNIPENLHSDYWADFMEQLLKVFRVEYKNNNEEDVYVRYNLMIAIATKPISGPAFNRKLSIIDDDL